MCNRLYFDPMATTTGDYYSVSTHYKADRVRFAPQGHAPGDWIYAVVEGKSGGRILTSFRWGFRPDDGKFFLARLETASVTSRWSRSYTSSRCIIPVTAYVMGEDLIEAPNQPFVSLAAMYDKARGAICLLTRPSSGEVREHKHSRMPVIVPSYMTNHWLSREMTNPDEMKTHLYTHSVDQRVVGQVASNAAA